MRGLLFVLLCFTASSTSCNGKEDAPPEEAAWVPPSKPAQLEGIGTCVTPICTLHFAVQATGDVDTFSVARCSPPACQSWTGKLKPTAQAKLHELAGRLIKERFEPAYGCPGCTDGPTHEVVIHHPDGRVLSHKLDPMRPDQAPPLLVEASKLIDTFTDALYRCEASALFEPAPDCKQIMEVEMKRPAGFP